jgi:hypothetical protein
MCTESVEESQEMAAASLSSLFRLSLSLIGHFSPMYIFWPAFGTIFRKVGWLLEKLCSFPVRQSSIDFVSFNKVHVVQLCRNMEAKLT